MKHCSAGASQPQRGLEHSNLWWLMEARSLYKTSGGDAFNEFRREPGPQTLEFRRAADYDNGAQQTTPYCGAIPPTMSLGGSADSLKDEARQPSMVTAKEHLRHEEAFRAQLQVMTPAPDIHRTRQVIDGLIIITDRRRRHTTEHLFQVLAPRHHFRTLELTSIEEEPKEEPREQGAAQSFLTATSPITNFPA